MAVSVKAFFTTLIFLSLLFIGPAYADKSPRQKPAPLLSGIPVKTEIELSGRQYNKIHREEILLDQCYVLPEIKESAIIGLSRFENTPDVSYNTTRGSLAYHYRPVIKTRFLLILANTLNGNVILEREFTRSVMSKPITFEEKNLDEHNYHIYKVRLIKAVEEYVESLKSLECTTTTSP